MGSVRVAYSGVEGAFAHIAAKGIFPNADIISYKNFDEAYESVESGQNDFVVLPIENSYAGQVGQVADLIFKGSLYVNDIYRLRITQNLLGIKGTGVEEIKTVYSHPQALAQSAVYIKEHGFETKEAVNTAVAAKEVADRNDRSIAAVASKETAKLYGLDVIASGINESKYNTTRFAVLSKNESWRMGEDRKTNFLMMFTVKNEAGALVKAINVISECGYNMRAVHSRPMHDLPWQYYFYIEVEGSAKQKVGEEMMRRLSEHCDMLKIVGHFYEEEELDG